MPDPTPPPVTNEERAAMLTAARADYDEAWTADAVRNLDVDDWVSDLIDYACLLERRIAELGKGNPAAEGPNEKTGQTNPRF